MDMLLELENGVSSGEPVKKFLVQNAASASRIKAGDFGVPERAGNVDPCDILPVDKANIFTDMH
eukprot:581260-Karenia_brevis.AAC.1